MIKSPVSMVYIITTLHFARPCHNHKPLVILCLDNNISARITAISGKEQLYQVLFLPFLTAKARKIMTKIPRVGDFMTHSPRTIGEDIPISTARDLMRNAN